MKTGKLGSKFFIIAIIAISLILGCILLIVPDSGVAEAAIGENKITTRVSGTLNGDIQKQEDGSVTFNGFEIATAEENLSQMYVILQGAGGSGGSSRGGASGAFILVLIKFNTVFNAETGNWEYPSIRIESGVGGTRGYQELDLKTFQVKYIPGDKGYASTISISGIGSITAGAGENGDAATYTYTENGKEITITDGGKVIVDDESGALNAYLSIEFQRNGKRGGYNRPIKSGEASTAFTLSMHKNGKLTTKFFGHKVGGASPEHSGGAASPYARGGNGSYNDLFNENMRFDAENGSRGSGGGSAIDGILHIGGHKVGSGDGGSGVVEIMG